MRARQGHRRAVGTLASVVAGLASLASPIATGSAAATSPAPILRLGAGVPVAPDARGHLTLTAISCPSAQGCVAVGADAAGRAAVTAGIEGDGRWRWTPARALSGAGALRLTGTSCPDPAICVAVGTDAAGRGDVVTAVRGQLGWAWSAPTAIVPDAAGGGALAGVSCPTVATCVAVGEDRASQGIVTTGVRTGSTWSWSKDAAVAPDGSGSGGLASVSCGAASSCVAVGTDAAAHAIATAGSGHGATWTWSAATTVGTASGTVAGVSCATGSWCVTLGDDASTHGEYAVGGRGAAGWSWSPMRPVGQLATITGVACRTLRLCVAVGSQRVGAATVGRYVLGHVVRGALVWSGSRAAPSGTLPVGTLAAVSCATLDACTAVGTAGDSRVVAVGSKAVPRSPWGVQVGRGDASATVAWRAPAFDGGAAVASYRAEAWPGGASCAVVAVGIGQRRCTVGHLVNGTRYRFTVTADNGIGVSPRSAPSPYVVPSPFQPPVASPLTAAVRRLVAASPGVVTATIYDVLTGQTWLVNPASVQRTASIVKVEILAALLHDEQLAHTTMPASTRQLATEMIEESDNSAAQALYVQVGQEPGLAAFNELVGLTGTTANWAWGATETTSLDQTLLVRLFALPNTVLDAASRAFGLALLRNIEPEQAWGVTAGVAPSAHVALKNGWYPTARLDWQVNSIGWIDGDGRDYVLAVMTDREATMGVGVTTIQMLSTMIWQRLAPRTVTRR